MDQEKAQQIGNRVVELRQLKGIGQEELKRRTGLYVWRIEHGYHVPTVQTLETLAEGLGVHVGELLKKPKKQTA